MTRDNIVEAATGYGVSVIGFAQDLNWVAIGSAALLVARLIVDVPKAIEMIRSWRSKPKRVKRGKRNR